jgi:hypothetical protein
MLVFGCPAQYEPWGGILFRGDTMVNGFDHETRGLESDLSVKEKGVVS